jgi:hypothetical protein
MLNVIHHKPSKLLRISKLKKLLTDLNHHSDGHHTTAPTESLKPNTTVIQQPKEEFKLERLLIFSKITRSVNVDYFFFRFEDCFSSTYRYI